MELSASNVESIMLDCLIKDMESNNGVAIDGVVHSYILDPKKLSDHSESIAEMLNELPKEFQKDTGGGMSFLNACNKKDGERWTGFHQRMEELFVLGMGSGKVKCLMSKELWPALPGGMPYYVVV